MSPNHRLALPLSVAGLVLLAGCGMSNTDAVACNSAAPQTCNTVAPSYATDIAPLISHTCSTCHGPGGVADARHDFTTYARVFAQRTDILSQLQDCLMPPDNGPNLSDAERQVLLQWLACNAPNN